MDSPALSLHSDFSDMDDDELDRYLANCVPLSNLPTPPPAKELPLPRAAAPASLPADNGRQHAPELDVYATHLANLVPRNVSSQTPSASVIRGFLERAGLPTEVIAFAACVLDALSSQFGSLWRDAFLPAVSSSKFYFGASAWPRPAACPDVIVLAALSLAQAFIDDRARSNSHWARIEGGCQFTARELEATKRSILEDMDYGLFRISPDMVERMMRDLQLVGHFSTRFFPPAKDSAATEKEERRPRPALSSGTPGTAIWTHGVQTPEPSP